MMVLVIAAIIFVERGHRRVTVQYAKRVVGRRHVRRVEHAHPAEGQHRRRHPGDLRVVDPGVPGDDRAGVPGRVGDASRGAAGVRHAAAQPALRRRIIFFAYFYTAIIFNPDDVAENMRKYGGFVPGIRPGKRTAEYIDTILARITLAGAIYLALIAILPQFLLERVQGGADSVHRRVARRGPAAVHHRGHGRAVLLRRHVAADRRRRRDGHGAAGRVAADHAALRRVHEEDAHSGDGVADAGSGPWR